MSNGQQGAEYLGDGVVDGVVAKQTDLKQQIGYTNLLAEWSKKKVSRKYSLVEVLSSQDGDLNQSLRPTWTCSQIKLVETLKWSEKIEDLGFCD